MSPSEERKRWDSCRAAIAKRKGLSNADIAALIGCEKDSVPARVMLGERLLSLPEYAHFLRESAP